MAICWLSPTLIFRLTDAANGGQRSGKQCRRNTDAILQLMPLDQYVDDPVSLMPLCGDDKDTPPIWAEIQEVVNKYNGKPDIKFVERLNSTSALKNAYAVVATGEERQYGCIILKKGNIAGRREAV